MQLSNNLASNFAFLAKLPQQKIAQVVSIILLGYIAYLLAELTWSVSTPQTSSVVMANRSVSNQAVSSDNDFNISKLKALNLFGHFNAKQASQQSQPVSQEIQEAPQTKLNLTLSGVVASDDVNVATAVIENKGKQNTLGVGDKIEGTRAILEKVFFDRVIIKHLGKFETLMLDGVKFQKNVAMPASRSNTTRSTAKSNNSKNFIDNRHKKSLSNQMSSLKRAVTGDPGKITDYLRISPKMKNGETVGYLLRPGKDPEFFKASGLKSGDVAVQMNGYDLTSPLDAAQALQALKTEPEVALWVDRNGEVTEILFSIEN